MLKDFQTSVSSVDIDETITSGSASLVPARSDPFNAALHHHGVEPLVRQRVTTVQINVGKRCNMACHHCHVDAGPKRTEMMDKEVASRIIDLIAESSGVETVDITGGAPELNPHFRTIVKSMRRLDRHVIDRCNLTIFFEPEMEDLPAFLAEHKVHIIASLPCYQKSNVDKQRGRGAFNKSIQALLRLNQCGYGRQDSPLRLDLVYNPLGAHLPPPQQVLESQYKKELFELFGIEFNHLLTLTNMPIKRFADTLRRSSQLERYQETLRENFNANTVPHLMCRTLISIAWDGRLFDCDFNQMLDLEIPSSSPQRTIWDLNSFDEFTAKPIATASHCFGCTAGSGSSCSGSIE